MNHSNAIKMLTMWLCLGVASVQGQISLSFDSGDVMPGEEITLTASITSQTTNPVLTAYNIPVDIGDNDFGLPTGVSVVSVQSENPFLTNFSSATPPGPPFNFDLVTSDSSADGFTVSDMATDLFSVTLAIAPDFQEPEFQVSFQDSPTPNPASFTLVLDGMTLNDVDVTTSGTVVVGAFLLGDINRDGSVNLLDVDPFIDLIGSGQFQAEGDINGDGVVNLLDVGGFILLLSN